MKDVKEIMAALEEAATAYDVDGPGTCKIIDAILGDEGFLKGGGEMALVDRWDRGNESIYANYNPARGRIGFSRL